MDNTFEGLNLAIANAEIIAHVDTVMLPQPICVQLGALGTTLDNVIEWPHVRVDK
jgi:hypothetical protein